MEEKPPGRALLREVTQRNKLQRERLRWHSCCSCRYLGRLGQSLSLHSRDVRAERGRHTTCNYLLSSLLLVCLLPLLHRASTALMCYIINLCYVGNPVILSAGQLWVRGGLDVGIVSCCSPDNFFFWFLSRKTRSKKFFAIDSSVVNIVVVLCSSGNLCHRQPLKFCVLPDRLHLFFREAQCIRIAKLGGRELLQEAELRSRGHVSR